MKKERIKAMAKADAGKKGSKGSKSSSTDQWAASRDTATLDRPDSGRNQRAAMGTGTPFDIAPREVLTPSAVTFERNDTADTDTVVGMPVTRERRDGTVVVETECPEGHAEGKAEVVAGTLGKTATCSECGSLLVATQYVEDGTGAIIEKDKDGRVSLREPKGVREAAKDEGRGAGPAQRFVTREDSLADEKKAAKAESRKAGTRRKSGTRKKAAAPKSEAKAEV
jgi:hypothetical protein